MSQQRNPLVTNTDFASLGVVRSGNPKRVNFTNNALLTAEADGDINIRIDQRVQHVIEGISRTLIREIDLSTQPQTDNIIIDNIPQRYQDIEVVVKGVRSAGVATELEMFLYQEPTATSYRTSFRTVADFSGGQARLPFIIIPSNTAPAGAGSYGIYFLKDYSRANIDKSILIDIAGTPSQEAVLCSSSYIGASVGDVITRVDLRLANNLEQEGTVQVWGIKRNEKYLTQDSDIPGTVKVNSFAVIDEIDLTQFAGQETIVLTGINQAYNLLVAEFENVQYSSISNNFVRLNLNEDTTNANYQYAYSQVTIFSNNGGPLNQPPFIYTRNANSVNGFVSSGELVIRDYAQQTKHIYYNRWNGLLGSTTSSLHGEYLGSNDPIISLSINTAAGGDTFQSGTIRFYGIDEQRRVKAVEGANEAEGREIIQTIDLSQVTAADTHTFTGIPATYTHLAVRTRDLRVGTATDFARVYLNGDTTNTNYQTVRLTGLAAGKIQENDALKFPIIPTGAPADRKQYAEFEIYDYAQTARHLTRMFASGCPSVDNVDGISEFITNNNPITSVSINSDGGNFDQQGTIELWGIIERVQLPSFTSTTAVSDADKETGFLQQKLTAGSGISLTVQNTGANETLQVTNTRVSTSVLGIYGYNNSAGAAASGEFRWDNTDPTLVTAISLHKTNEVPGIERDTFFALFPIEEGNVILFENNEPPPAEAAYFTVTGVTDLADRIDLTVTYIDDTGAWDSGSQNGKNHVITLGRL